MNILKHRIDAIARQYDQEGYGGAYVGGKKLKSNYGYLGYEDDNDLMKHEYEQYKGGVLMGAARKRGGVLMGAAKRRRAGVLMGAARKPRKLSEYNKFFAHHRKMGYSPSDIGNMWREMKGEGRRRRARR